MEKYLSYKDSGVQWLGEIPSHWKVKKIRHILSLANKKTKESGGELLSLSQYAGVTPKTDSNVGIRAAEDTTGYNIVHKGQFVMNIMLAWNGSYAVSEYDGIISPAYCVFDFTRECDRRYYNYLLRMKVYSGAFKTESKGIIDSRLRLYPQYFKNFPLIVPPIEEQRSMATYLDKATAEIDRAIAQQQRMIDLLNERKQIIIQRAVTKGLDENVEMKNSGIEWIGEIPVNWEVCKLKHLFKRIADGTHFSPKSIDDGYPYLTAADVRGIGINYESTKKISTKDYHNLVSAGCKAFEGDILIVKDGATTGRVGLKTDNVECVTLSSVAMLTPQDIESTYYLMYMMMSDSMQKQISFSMSGAAMPRITLVKLKNFYAIKPPVLEQVAIVEFIKSRLEPVN
jgi:type I restriction enzyme S subunit